MSLYMGDCHPTWVLTAVNAKLTFDEATAEAGIESVRLVLVQTLLCTGNWVKEGRISLASLN